MEPFWSVGDLCVHKYLNGKDYVVGRVQETNQAESTCQVETFDSNGSLSCPVDELHRITLDTVKLIKLDSNSYSSLLETINASFFEQKLEKLLAVRTLDEKVLLKTCRPVPVIAVQQDTSGTGHSNWHIGDLCICQWSEDDSYYYCSIVTINDSLCTVSFCYYDNEEDKDFHELHRVGSDIEVQVEDEYNEKAFQQLQSSFTSYNANNSSINPKLRQIKQSPSPRPTSRFYSGSSSLKSSLKKTVAGKSNQHRNQPATATLPESGDLSQDLPYDSRSQTPLADPTTSSDMFRPPLHLLPPAYPSQLFADLKQTPWQAMLISWFMCGYHTGFYEALHPDEEKKQ